MSGMLIDLAGVWSTIKRITDSCVHTCINHKYSQQKQKFHYFPKMIRPCQWSQMSHFYKSVLVWSKNLFIIFYTLRLLPSSLGQGILINANRKLHPNSISPPIACFCQQVVTFFVSHIFRSHIFRSFMCKCCFQKILLMSLSHVNWL